jgi:hypothetical protein
VNGVKGGKARNKRALLLRAMRAHKPLRYLLSIASRAVIENQLRRWSSLHAYYRSDACPAAHRMPKRPPAPNHIKRALERALRDAENAESGDAYAAGRASLAREILAIYER